MKNFVTDMMIKHLEAMKSNCRTIASEWKLDSIPLSTLKEIVIRGQIELTDISELTKEQRRVIKKDAKTFNSLTKKCYDIAERSCKEMKSTHVPLTVINQIFDSAITGIRKGAGIEQP